MMTSENAGLLTDFEVHTQTYMTGYHFVAKDLVFFDRKHNFPHSVSDIDVFGPSWSVALADLPEGKLAVHRLGKEIPIVGPSVMFIPPFSIIDWRLSAGNINWSAFISNVKVPLELPQKPMLFRGLPHQPLKSAEEIFDFIGTLEPVAASDKIETENMTALRLKEKIDQNFSSQKSIEELAEELRASHAAMTRVFTKTFGLSPINYRNRMRINEAMRLILMEGKKSNAACFEVGFSDLSRFNEWFRRQMIAVPSQFSPQKSAAAKAKEPTPEMG